MDRIEALLRDELARVAGGATFPANEIISGVRRRRRRRAATTAATVALTVLLAGGATAYVATGRYQSVGPAEPSVAPSLSVTIPARALFWPGVLHGTTVAPLGGVMVDQTHGYLMVVRCELRDEIPCDLELALTTDGGATWTRRDAPPVRPMTAIGDAPSSLVALGPDTLVYQCEFCGARDDPPHRLLSTDAGRTWRELDRFASRPTDEVPPGALVYLNWDGGPRPGMRVLLPDGTILALLTAPQDFNPWGQVVETSDGTLFLAGKNTIGEGEAEVTSVDIRVSRNRGRTWQQLASPYQRPVGVDDYSSRGSLLTVDGRVLYYLSSFTTDGTGQGPAVTAIYRSTDGGASWRQLALPKRAPRLEPSLLANQMKGYASEDPTGDFISAAVVEDGSLLLTRAGRLYRLPPSSSTFVAVPPGFGGLHVTQVGTAVLGVDLSPPTPSAGTTQFTHVFALTRDALTWTPLTLD